VAISGRSHISFDRWMETGSALYPDRDLLGRWREYLADHLGGDQRVRRTPKIDTVQTQAKDVEY
jgi:hypothetical protein